MSWYFASYSQLDAQLVNRMQSTLLAVSLGFLDTLVVGQELALVKPNIAQAVFLKTEEQVQAGTFAVSVPTVLEGLFSTKNVSFGFRLSSGQVATQDTTSVSVRVYKLFQGLINGSSPLSPLLGASVRQAATRQLGFLLVSTPIRRGALLSALRSDRLTARCLRWSNNSFQSDACEVELVDLTRETVTCKCSLRQLDSRRLMQSTAPQDFSLVVVGDPKSYDCELYSKNCSQQQYLQGCGNESKGSCVTCSTCDAGQYQVQPCTSQQDRRCSPCSQLSCASGFYRSACGGGSTGSCRVCKNCSAGEVQLVGCAEGSTQQDALCLPSGAAGGRQGQLQVTMTVRISSENATAEALRQTLLASVARLVNVSSDRVQVEGQGGQLTPARRLLLVSSDLVIKILLDLNADWKSVSKQLTQSALSAELSKQSINVQVIQGATLSIVTVGTAGNTTVVESTSSSPATSKAEVESTSAPDSSTAADKEVPLTTPPGVEAKDTGGPSLMLIVLLSVLIPVFVFGIGLLIYKYSLPTAKPTSREAARTGRDEEVAVPEVHEAPSDNVPPYQEPPATSLTGKLQYGLPFMFA
ncbi:hypothetical protein GUITHDRAFT_145856 [Guillardia theta CCMP2712]|uniref:TNFR-Cys domain-containing protein n=1 Tax=Guillardia theta (strain CCMP2712) TaxID=905079 RepID=L1IK59_GUITC|nr:hypothetical protein GUITHDRAFT_145856 [Guillardia theta CCMP2712]EKX36284.1 hypothetical protein GUITHDRAFT_145856 [Guillardia theta CCMP2712]|eukprot:XP_005823264.1 hypothetical protein GUITHDRAFT_145856 [Guillardia theta CCMP2712]